MIKELTEKYLNGEATAEEREQLLRGLQDDTDIARWLRADMELAEDRIPQQVKERVLNNVISSDVKQQHHGFSGRSGWLTAACVVLCVLVASLGGYMIGNNAHGQDVATALTVQTNLGEHSQVTLPDGTEVTLNALTTLHYDYSSATGVRHVSVDGEAFFNVAKDAEHPFEVSAGDVAVRCLGTSFNVRNYEDEKNISVVLTEGRVRVSAAGGDLTMEPDSRVVFDKNTLAMSKLAVESKNYICWLSGEVRYNDQTLEDIAAELSRNYHIQMVITSDRLRQERFTGYLGSSSLRNVLDVLCLASNMNYHIDQDTVVYIYERK